MLRPSGVPSPSEQRASPGEADVWSPRPSSRGGTGRPSSVPAPAASAVIAAARRRPSPSAIAGWSGSRLSSGWRRRSMPSAPPVTAWVRSAGRRLASASLPLLQLAPLARGRLRGGALELGPPAVLALALDPLAFLAAQALALGAAARGGALALCRDAAPRARLGARCAAVRARLLLLTALALGTLALAPCSAPSRSARAVASALALGSLALGLDGARSLATRARARPPPRARAASARPAPRSRPRPCAPPSRGAWLRGGRGDRRSAQGRGRRASRRSQAVELVVAGRAPQVLPSRRRDRTSQRCCPRVRRPRAGLAGGIAALPRRARDGRGARGPACASPCGCPGGSGTSESTITRSVKKAITPKAKKVITLSSVRP